MNKKSPLIQRPLNLFKVISTSITAFPSNKITFVPRIVYNRILTKVLIPKASKLIKFDRRKRKVFLSFYLNSDSMIFSYFLYLLSIKFSSENPLLQTRQKKKIKVKHEKLQEYFPSKYQLIEFQKRNFYLLRNKLEKFSDRKNLFCLNSSSYSKEKIVSKTWKLNI